MSVKVRKIVSSVLSFVGAAFLICFAVFGCLISLSLSATVNGAMVFAMIILTGVPLIIVGLIVWGGIWILATERKIAFELNLFAILCTLIYLITFLASGVFPWFYQLNLVFATLFLVAAEIFVPDYGKKSHAFVAAFVCLLSGVLFFVYLKLGLAHSEYSADSYAYGAVVCAVIGGGLSGAGVVRSRKGRTYGYECSLLGLLMMAAQYLIVCTVLTDLFHIVYVLLGIGGIITVIVGGVLIADVVESGFVITSFGIIFLIVWVGMIFLFVGWTVAVGVICNLIGIVLVMVNAIEQRRAQNSGMPAFVKRNG